jgi:hypothetical protein
MGKGMVIRRVGLVREKKSERDGWHGFSLGLEIGKRRGGLGLKCLHASSKTKQKEEREGGMINQMKNKKETRGSDCMGHALHLMHSLRGWCKLAWAMHEH